MKKKRKKYSGTEEEINAFLGRDTDFVGKLVFNGAVRLDGRFSGEIFSNGNLIIGESAVISAEIKVDTIVISGTVNGNVDAKKRMEIYPPGKLYGNIKCPVLVINEGVIFEGNCQMGLTKGEEEKMVLVEDVSDKKEREKGGLTGA
ncbi:MAG: polymer-forming cytoskeletal protein [Pseudomonadota bacterium]